MGESGRTVGFRALNSNATQLDAAELADGYINYAGSQRFVGGENVRSLQTPDDTLHLNTMPKGNIQVHVQLHRVEFHFSLCNVTYVEQPI